MQQKSQKYHSPLRAKQAEATRLAIIEGALKLFEQHGWAMTTLPMVADSAGVSVDTIYSTFGTKSALFMAVVHLAIVGDDNGTAMADRPDFALLGVGRRPERLRVGVRYAMDVYERSVRLLRTLREAAASDDAARTRLDKYDEDRRDLIATGMALILDEEASDEIVDSIWALMSPEVYSHLLDGRRWSTGKLEDWFVDLAKTAISRA